MRQFYLLLFFLTFLYSCSTQEQEPKKIEVLRVGVLPDESLVSLKKRHQSLLDYLAKQFGIPVELVIPKDYQELVFLIGNNQIDLGYFGGVTFVQASEKYGIMPVVMRDIDETFSSYFLARRDYPGNKLEDFQNTRLSFGNRLSTSGYFMPLHFLQERGINPSEFFTEVMFSGSHDASLYHLRDGKTDIVAANSKIVQSMIKDGRISENEIRLVWETPPFADYVWAIRKGLGKVWKQKITDAFFSLSLAENDHIQILQDQRARGFIPASLMEFSDLRNIMRESL